MGVNQPVWTTEGARKRAAIRNMFAEIAPTYDRLNGLMSLSLHRRWRALAVSQLNLRPGDRALDVCSGTGDFLRPLTNVVGREGIVIGLDFCAPMLELARRKVDGESVALSLGDACRLPIADASVHAVTVGWGLRNVADIDEAHEEIVRVLQPGGRFVSLDMARPKNTIVRFISEFLFNNVVPWLGSLVGRTQAYAYLPQSTQRFKTREQLAASMSRAGLVDVRFRDLMLGNICLHFGRKREADEPGFKRTPRGISE